MSEYIAWLRGQVGPALLPLAYVTAIVHDPAGRILFQRRTDFGAAWWGLPGGGIDTGETLAHTAQRETREETGLEVEPVRLLAVGGGYYVDFPNGDRTYPIGSLFACRPVGGRLRADGRETHEVGFFARDQLPPLAPRARQLAQLAFDG